MLLFSDRSDFMPNFSSPAWPIASRIFASLVGGYLFTWGLIAIIIAGLIPLGVEFHDVEMGMLMLGLLVYLSLFLWGMATDKLIWLWLILFGGGVAMTVMASVVQQSFLQGI